MKSINVNIFLNEFKSGTDPVLLKYVKSSSPGIGEIRGGLYMYGISAHSAKSDSLQLGKIPDRNRWKYLGLIPVVNMDSGDLQTLKLSHIIQYKNMIVVH